MDALRNLEPTQLGLILTTIMMAVAVLSLLYRMVGTRRAVEELTELVQRGRVTAVDESTLAAFTNLDANVAKRMREVGVAQAAMVGEISKMQGDQRQLAAAFDGVKAANAKESQQLFVLEEVLVDIGRVINGSLSQDILNLAIARGDKEYVRAEELQDRLYDNGIDKREDEL